MILDVPCTTELVGRFDGQLTLELENANDTPGYERRGIPLPGLWIKHRRYNGKRDATGSALVVRRCRLLGEGDEVAARVLDGKFAHTVEGGALGHDFLYILHGG